MSQTALAPATCLSNTTISVERASCQAQLYRHPETGAYVAILCFATERDAARLPELAAHAARYYRALPAEAESITWLLYLPARQAPEACGGVYCPDADACYTLAMQLAGWRELHEVADCVNSLAQRLQRGRVLVPATELGAAWGAALAAVRSELDEREEVRDAA